MLPLASFENKAPSFGPHSVIHVQFFPLASLKNENEFERLFYIIVFNDGLLLISTLANPISYTLYLILVLALKNLFSSFSVGKNGSKLDWVILPTSAE